MNDIDQGSRAVLEELARRKTKKKPKKKFDVAKFCKDHIKQLQFIQDRSKFKTGCCSRRAGKTVACAADLIAECQANANINCLYITLSRRSAKNIIWKQLLQINYDFGLGGKSNETELTLTFSNGSTIYVSGAKDSQEIEKFRGMAFYKVYIDEAQSFRGYIYELIDDVLVPALYDYDGKLIMIGTPNASATGAFHDACHEKAGFKGWSHHHWTILDNPYIEKKAGKPVEQILNEELARRGVTKEDPTFQRESLGRWIKDYDSLVFKFDAERNTFAGLGQDVDYQHIIGVDLGFDDAFAISVLAFSTEHPVVYHIDEYIKPGMIPSECAKVLQKFIAKYNPIKIVADTGGLGKAIVEEFRERHNFDIEPAEKHKKFEYIELFNDDLRTAKFKVFVNSQFCEDVKLIEWDLSRSRRRIKDTFHSDIADAVVYAWRECYHYLYETPHRRPRFGSPEYWKQVEEEMVAQESRELEQNNDSWVDNLREESQIDPESFLGDGYDF